MRILYKVVTCLVILSASLTVANTLMAQQAENPKKNPVISNAKEMKWALSGIVTSADKKPMEGVLVSAKRAGSIVTITVVSDEQGRYRFPASKLDAGDYALSIRAAGYELDTPKKATVGGSATNVDLHLQETTDLAGQLTNAEWVMSMPGTEAQKRPLLDCVGCHSLQRIVSSRYTEEEWIPIIQRMLSVYAQNTTPLNPQRLVKPRNPSPESVHSLAKYLASINMSQGLWKYPLKPLARPKGKATHVVITEYDLPNRLIQPHDVIVDAQGVAWFNDFGQQILGSLDPKTLKIDLYDVPVTKPGSPMGGLDLETDKAGNLYEAMMFQGGVAIFSKQTHQFTMIPISPEYNNASTQQTMATPPGSDGKLWTKDSGSQTVLRYTLATGQWERFGPFTTPEPAHQTGFYGLNADSKNNAYLMDFTEPHGEYIAKIDAQTGQVTYYHTVSNNTRPRRARFDAQDRLWFAEYGGNAIGMLDTKTGKMSEWKMATPWAAPYDAVADKNNDVWTGSMWNDRVTRLDPKSGAMIDYLLPRSTNIRRVFVDNSTNPVTFWVGSNHGASILKLEPSD
jgi:virginiamycin B lyase